MKKRILLFTILIVGVASAMMSNEAGLAHTNGLNRTGSDNGAVGCGGTSCHQGGNYSNTAMVPRIDVYDDQGHGANSFLPGQTYVIKLKGTSTAPKWGFQVSASHTDTGGTVHSAGWMSGTPPHAHDTFIGNYSVVEQWYAWNVVNDTIAATVYWLAPTMPIVDTVVFHFTICNVDGDGTVDGDNFTTYTDTLGHWTTTTEPVNASSISNEDELKITAFPNPVVDKLNVSLENAGMGIYNISVFDMMGKVVMTENAIVTNSYKTSINTAAWASGRYHLLLKKDGVQKVVGIVK